MVALLECVYFPALFTRFRFSRAFHRYQVNRACRQLLVFPRFSSVPSIPRLPPTTCFRALFIGIKYTAPVAGCLFSRAFHRYQVYRACRRLLVFPCFSLVSSIPRLSPAACFPVLFIGIKYTAPVANCLFSYAFHWYPVSRTFQRLHIFPRFWVTGVISQLFGSYQSLFLTFPFSKSP